MADLDIRTALTQIEVALATTIENAIGKTITVADLTALRALASNARKHGDLAYVTSAAYRYRFNRYATTADNGTTVIKPTDNPTAGRWERTTSTSATGYLKQVRLWEGERNEEDLLTWLFGNVPSVVIVWEGEEYEPRAGGYPGTLYKYKPEFSVWAVSRNLRLEKQGATGSQIATEATADPGVNRIIGDLRRALAGSSLAQDGVDWAEITRSDRVLSSHERGHVYRLGVKVYATIHNNISPDDDATALTRIDVDFQAANQYGLADDAYPDDVVTATNYLAVTQLAPGQGQIVGGAATVNGVAVTAATVSTVGLIANQRVDRYLDTSGAWRFAVKDLAEPAEEPQSDEVYVGWHTSDASQNLVMDCIVAPFLVTTGVEAEIDLT